MKGDIMNNNGDGYIIDLGPFVAEAIAHNEAIHKDIDELYQKNSDVFRNCAKKSKYYNHTIFKQKSIIQEEYAMKALGIIEFLKEPCDSDNISAIEKKADIGEEFFNIIEEGWQYVYEYVKSRKIIDLSRFIKSVDSKNGGLEYIPGSELVGMITILIGAGRSMKRKFVENAMYCQTIHVYKRRLEFKGIDETRLTLAGMLSDEDKEDLKRLKEKIHSFGGEIKTYDDIDSLVCKYLSSVVSEILESSGSNLTISNLADKISLDEKDIEFVLYSYKNIMKAAEENPRLDSEDLNFILILIYGLNQLLVLKHYEQIKEYYIKNNNQTLNSEITQLKKLLNNKSSELDRVIKKNQELKNRLSLAEKSLSRLRDEEIKNNLYNQELFALREFIFSLNNDDSYKIDKDTDTCIDINEKCAIVGGHHKWQRKMKEHFPNFVFLTSENLNFDVNLIKGCDVVFINISNLSHALYYKVMGAIRKTKSRIVYLGQRSNILLNIQQINKVFHQDQKIA